MWDMLVQNGANTDLKNIEGKTPDELAMSIRLSN